MSKPTDLLDRHARAIAADRNFNAAATSYTEAFVAWRRSLGGFNKVVSSNARRRIANSILSLHFGNGTDNPDEGATFERLLGHCHEHPAIEGCGPRVLRTVIALAQRSGHLSVQPGWHDRRLKILRPTEKWIEQEGERHEVALSSLALLTLDRSRFQPTPRGAALVARLAVASGRAPLLGVALGEADGTMQEIVALDGGLATSFAIADAWSRSKRLPSHKEIGESFRLSASQARKILRIAYEHGLLAFDRAGKISDASALADECRRLVAHEFALYARCVTPVEAPTSEPILAPLVVDQRTVEHAH